MYPQKTIYAKIIMGMMATTIFTIIIGGLNHSLTTAETNDQAKILHTQLAQNQMVDPNKPAHLPQSSSLALPVNSTLITTTIFLPIIMGPETPTTQSCNATNGSGGLAAGTMTSSATVAGLNASVVVGPGYDPNTPTLLGFQIHGDNGNWEKFGDKSTNEVTTFVNNNNWVFVAPQSPNSGFSWWSNQNGDHVAQFAAVLDEMFAKYNVCRNIVFGSSGSGGSEFWTRMFFPNKGGDYPAHTLISCGGNDVNGNASDEQKVTDLGNNTDVVARSTFYYLYGTNDSLTPLIEQSIQLYTNAGFKVKVEKLIEPGGEPADHCNKWTGAGLPSQSAQIATKWAEFAADLGITTN